MVMWHIWSAKGIRSPPSPSPSLSYTLFLAIYISFALKLMAVVLVLWGGGAAVNPTVKLYSIAAKPF